MNPYVSQIKSIANENKYTKYYCDIIERALLRRQDRNYLKGIYGYVESHHILPKCFKLGGEKDKQNLVFLTAKEHFIVHLCATKMFESVFKNKMIFAFRQLKSKNNHQSSRVNSRLYEIIKPNFKSFVRLYKNDVVKYVYDSEINEILLLESDGWSKIMTNEYKNKSSKGGMIGKKHSEETKKKMSESSLGKPKLKLRGYKHPQERIEKTKESKERIKKENPELYAERVKKQSEAMKADYASGKRKPPIRPAGPHSQETLEKMSVERKRWWKECPPEKKMEINKKASASRKLLWASPEKRIRASLTGTTAYRVYGMEPQEFYDQKLKPLIYLGFLPTAIIKYKLINLTKGSIKRLIKNWGTEEDLAKFEESKKRGAGANHAYIKFQEDLYIKHFKKDSD